ncbi:hypothetical protein [Burkholderia cepacia]|nr:hypothetical protein [Burkholderia cepacia]
MIPMPICGIAGCRRLHDDTGGAALAFSVRVRDAHIDLSDAR